MEPARSLPLRAALYPSQRGANPRPAPPLKEIFSYWSWIFTACRECSANIPDAHGLHPDRHVCVFRTPTRGPIQPWSQIPPEVPCIVRPWSYSKKRFSAQFLSTSSILVTKNLNYVINKLCHQKVTKRVLFNTFTTCANSVSCGKLIVITIASEESPGSECKK